MNSHKNIILAVCFSTIGITGLLWYILNWDSGNINLHSKSIKHCIDSSEYGGKVEKSIFSVTSFFKINLAMSDNTCINPYFPAITIDTDSTQHSAWLHIVHTDTNSESLKLFIDAQDDAPFYNYNKVFSDAPLWTYTILTKPLTYWKGHAYSVNIQGNRIKCLGGVKWGFSLSRFGIRPSSITPTSLTIDDFLSDIEKLIKAGNTMLSHYEINR